MIFPAGGVQYQIVLIERGRQKYVYAAMRAHNQGHGVVSLQSIAIPDGKGSNVRGKKYTNPEHSLTRCSINASLCSFQNIRN